MSGKQVVRLEYACQANDFRNESGVALLDLALALREHPISLLDQLNCNQP